MQLTTVLDRKDGPGPKPRAFVQLKSVHAKANAVQIAIRATNPGIVNSIF